ncbi:hypothetical protein ACJQWK_02991 [Exserohilum turcicum]
MRLQTLDSRWRGKRVGQYLRQVDRFLELLLFCVHVTSGQPGRGSEITTIRHRNGLLQDRNVFVVDGRIMTVVRYHKSQSQFDKPKIVPRFLPPQLGQVMAVYLAYLQPFREYLVVKVLGGGLSDYVWSDKHGAWNIDRLTRVIKRETGKRLGVSLHTLGYRHTAVGIGRVKVLGKQDVGFRSVEQEQALHAVLEKQTPLIVVLPTGGGKSLLFTLPACVEETGVTVVVVPYRALIEDLVGRIQRCGVDCIEWKYGENDPASVVVVSADVAGDIKSGGNFLGYARTLKAKGLLH